MYLGRERMVQIWGERKMPTKARTGRELNSQKWAGTKKRSMVTGNQRGLNIGFRVIVWYPYM